MGNFIAITDHSPDEIRHFLDVAKRLKQQLRQSGKNDPVLAGKTLAMLFEKPSLRTRVSFNVGMTQLGGVGMYLTREEVGIGTREPVQDVSRVLASMCDGIMARTFEHSTVTGLAKYSKVPVINGLTNFNHPCQAMADVMTVQEHFGKTAGLTWAFIGDGNNVARSIAAACGKLDMRFIIASPTGYEFSAEEVKEIKAQLPRLDFTMMSDPAQAVRSADIVVTDTWVSMGQEAEKQKRIKDFAGFQVDQKLLDLAPKHAIVLHCLPAYRGLEISEEVIESPRSLVFAEAENRLHAQKGILAVLLGNM